MSNNLEDVQNKKDKAIKLICENNYNNTNRKHFDFFKIIHIENLDSNYISRNKNDLQNISLYKKYLIKIKTNNQILNDCNFILKANFLFHENLGKYIEFKKIKKTKTTQLIDNKLEIYIDKYEIFENETEISIKHLNSINLSDNENNILNNKESLNYNSNIKKSLKINDDNYEKTNQQKFSPQEKINFLYNLNSISDLNLVSNSHKIIKNNLKISQNQNRIHNLNDRTYENEKNEKLNNFNLESNLHKKIISKDITFKKLAEDNENIEISKINLKDKFNETFESFGKNDQNDEKEICDSIKSNDVTYNSNYEIIPNKKTKLEDSDYSKNNVNTNFNILSLNRSGNTIKKRKNFISYEDFDSSEENSSIYQFIDNYEIRFSKYDKKFLVSKNKDRNKICFFIKDLEKVNQENNSLLNNEYLMLKLISVRKYPIEYINNLNKIIKVEKMHLIMKDYICNYGLIILDNNYYPYLEKEDLIKIGSYYIIKTYNLSENFIRETGFIYTRVLTDVRDLIQIKDKDNENEFFQLIDDLFFKKNFKDKSELKINPRLTNKKYLQRIVDSKSFLKINQYNFLASKEKNYIKRRKKTDIFLDSSDDSFEDVSINKNITLINNIKEKFKTGIYIIDILFYVLTNEEIELTFQNRFYNKKIIITDDCNYTIELFTHYFFECIFNNNEVYKITNVWIYLKNNKFILKTLQTTTVYKEQYLTNNSDIYNAKKLKNKFSIDFPKEKLKDVNKLNIDNSINVVRIKNYENIIDFEKQFCHRFINFDHMESFQTLFYIKAKIKEINLNKNNVYDGCNKSNCRGSLQKTKDGYICEICCTITKIPSKYYSVKLIVYFENNQSKIMAIYMKDDTAFSFFGILPEIYLRSISNKSDCTIKYNEQFKLLPIKLNTQPYFTAIPTIYSRRPIEHYFE